MTQKTNLNVSPYYDDFDSEKNYYKVLYKPGFPVQARELTSSQSIIQNQIEEFGDNIYKDGSPINGGEIAYVNQFNAVKLNLFNYGIDISVYLDKFIGKKITGETSGITAIIKHIAYPNTDPVDDITVYVTYLSSDNAFSLSSFTDGEQLSCNENIVYGNTTIVSGTTFASLVSSNATAIGSAAYIESGTYYIRGYFVHVSSQKIVLDYYNNKPSYKVGLKISETIIGAKDDGSLYDNAKGFTNYAAPGADRLKIGLTLTKKLLTDNDDSDFVELMRIKDGKIKQIITKTQWNKIGDTLADRTYDESGHYAIDPFVPSIHHSLNNREGNNGLFFSNQKTEQNNTPSDDLMCIKISPGKAYVRGYEVNKVGTTILDIEKPRDVGVKTDTGVNFDMGNYLRVNKVEGVPKQGDIVTLYDNFQGNSPAGIGSARVYGLNLEDNAYVDDTSVWRLRLFDVQTYTSISLNQSISSTNLPTGSYVQGKSSGASGYSVEWTGGSTSEFNLTQTSGRFAKGEQLIINGVDYPRTVAISTAYNTQNIKSVTSGATNYPNFEANSHIQKFRLPSGINIVDISAASDGVSTITAGKRPFNGLRSGSIVRYQRAGFSTETYNKVVGISSDRLSVDIVALNNVSDVYVGEIPASAIQVTMFAGGPIMQGSGTLFVPLANANVSDVTLSNSELRVTKQSTTQATNPDGKLTLPLSTIKSDYPEIENAIFEGFEPERYSVHYSDGSVGSVKGNTFSWEDGGNQISIQSLAQSQSNVVVNSTINKQGIRSKIKEYVRSKTIDIIYSKYEKSGDVAVGLGASTVSDGLKFDRRYGLRVQDEEISLNYPDVVKVSAVYESYDVSPPTFDILEFTSSVNVTKNAVIGEKLVSSEKNIVAQVVTKPDTNKLGIVYLTIDKFTSSDEVYFEESNITTNIETITNGRYKNITNKFTLDKGQKDEYYDYSRLVRNATSSEPARRLLIVFDYYNAPSSTQGDAFTVLSYGEGRFSTDIPNIGRSGIRASDTIDFRPSVPVYDINSSTVSPFHFDSRSFTIDQYATPNEITKLGYEHYLPRVDKLYANKFGNFIYEKGVSSIDPKPPIQSPELMEIGTIKLPPYLYNPQNASMTLVDNRRYTMRDVGYIDDRVANLEEVTSLTMLELNTQTLQIQDSDGKNRFKTGFFVDGFQNYSGMNKNLSTVEINPFANEITPPRTRNTLEPQIAPSKSIISSELDFREDFILSDPNVKKTGNAITLNYDEVTWIEQLYATEEVNVNPYELPTYTGTIQLDPQVDTWTNTVQTEDRKIQQSGRNATHNMQLDLSMSDTKDLGERVTNTETRIRHVDPPRNNDIQTGRFTTQVSSEWVEESRTTLSDSASDSITISNTDTIVRNQLISSIEDNFMRSRNTEFRSTGFPDYTKCYLFVDGEKIDFIPKLLEITPSSNGNEYGSVGSFKIGEEVQGIDSNGNVTIKFRLCSPNHKGGSYNNPDEVYPYDPYSSGTISVPSNYSQSSRTLNVDTRALAEEAQGKYFGYVTNNTKLIGLESNAEAYVKDLRLISDSFGDIYGSFFLRDPYSIPAPSVRINTGSKTVRISTSSENKQSLAGADSEVVFAETRYTANGTTATWQNELTEITNTDTINVGASADITLIEGATHTHNHTDIVTIQYTDPLAQTFVVGGNVDAPSAVNQANEDYNGAFITAVDIFFYSIDDVAESPIECQIRETTGDARPSRTVIGRSVVLRPTKVDATGTTVNLIEADPNFASKATKFTFPEPIFLEAGKSYAVVLLAPKSVKYKVWTARTGKTAVNAQSIPGTSTGESFQYTTQFGTGALFKSQNGALWTEDQTQDLTFRLYKAKFTANTGTATFYNPDLDESNGYVPSLLSDSIRTINKTGSIGITTISNTSSVEEKLDYLSSMLAPGRKIMGAPTGYESSTAVITGVGCSVTNTDKTEPGTGYKVSSNVSTFAITGKGSGLQFDITSVDSVDGGINGYNIIHGKPGNGYQIGDVVGIGTTITGGGISAGVGARFTITEIGGIDTLYLENIQGDNNAFAPGSTQSLRFFDNDNSIENLGITTTIRSNNINESGINKGSYFKVDSFNHGMYSTTNKVSISGVESDVPSTVLSSSLSSNELSQISVGDTSNFTTFEGLPVGTIAGVANTGYVKIGTEIIGYKDVGDGYLTIADSPDGRGINGGVFNHDKDDSIVSKYEVSGVSLRRINTNHNISSLGKELDSYTVEIDRTANGTDRNSDVASIPQLSFSDNKFVGGSNSRASENLIYNAIVPRFNVFTPSGNDGGRTGIDARIRTISGTSIGGNENSFEDKGFESVQLNRYNSLNDVRIVASKVNENEYLTGFPRNKSFTTTLTLSTTNENLSPIIFVRGNSQMEFISTRLNNPIGSENYASNGKVNSILEDPHTAIYASNGVRLSKPATSLKVLFSAYRDASADFRVLYSLDRVDSSGIQQTFELFPGYKNLRDIDDDGFGDVVIDESNNDGRPDAIVPASRNNQYLEYQYTADNLDLFIGYTIKIVMLGTDQSKAPRIREFRTIAIR